MLLKNERLSTWWVYPQRERVRALSVIWTPWKTHLMTTTALKVQSTQLFWSATSQRKKVFLPLIISRIRTASKPLHFWSWWCRERSRTVKRLRITKIRSGSLRCHRYQFQARNRKRDRPRLQIQMKLKCIFSVSPSAVSQDKKQRRR